MNCHDAVAQNSTFPMPSPSPLSVAIGNVEKALAEAEFSFEGTVTLIVPMNLCMVIYSYCSEVLEIYKLNQSTDFCFTVLEFPS
jgi:hypothetical protein